LGTFPVPREIPFRASSNRYSRIEIGNEIASASAFPSATWERGKMNMSVRQPVFAIFAFIRGQKPK